MSDASILLEVFGGSRNIGIKAPFGEIVGHVVDSERLQVENWVQHRHGLFEAEVLDSVRADHRIALLNSIRVEEGLRNRGHGNDLMEAFLHNARLEGASAVYFVADTHEDQAEGFEFVPWCEGWGAETVAETSTGPLMKITLD